jgi:hypothetical protein
MCVTMAAKKAVGVITDLHFLLNVGRQTIVIA